MPIILDKLIEYYSSQKTDKRCLLRQKERVKRAIDSAYDGKEVTAHQRLELADSIAKTLRY